MAERIDWLDDGNAGGSPYSPRFGDRYRSEWGGLEQAREVFLAGCGLPKAWAGQPQWCVLETGFGLGLNFLVTWAAWKADPKRPRLLHFVSTEAFPASAADVLKSVQTHPKLLPLAQQLQRQLWGLLPGFHRLVFEGGQVLLTLCIGDAKAMLRDALFEADSIYLDGFNPPCNPDIWDVHTFKAVARCCRRGTRVATWTVARTVRDALTQCGFVMKKVPGAPPKRDNLQGEYQPAWEPKKKHSFPTRGTAARCIVIGAGLAGAAVAASLARRGWQVTVLDTAGMPAAGASGLPAGLLAPHVSPDDSLLSRLSRSGIRATWQQVVSLLQIEQDWSPSGVLEHGVERSRQLPAAWQHPSWAEASRDWTQPATPEQLADCRLPLETQALWHVRAGWIKPASLVKAWLTNPGVFWRGHAAVSRLTRQGDCWQAFDATGQELASAELLVLAAGPATGALAEMAGLKNPPALQAIRGQMSWALREAQSAGALPTFPANGHGSLAPAVPLSEGLAWIAGSGFTRDCASTELRREDEQLNFSKLKALLPSAAEAVTPQFESGKINGWAGVRCATPNRLPVLGPLDLPDLWVCSGMGSRGLTFAALCAELLAARLHGEPWPIEQRLADAMLPQCVPPAYTPKN